MLDGCSFDSFDEGGMEVRQIDSLPQNLMAAARIAAREVVRDLNRESQLPPTLMNLPDPSKRPIQRLFKGKTWCKQTSQRSPQTLVWPVQTDGENGHIAKRAQSLMVLVPFVQAHVKKKPGSC